MIQNVPAAVQDPARLAALRSLHILDTPPDPVFDRLTGIATRVLGLPISLISLIDADRQVLKSSRGLPEPWRSRGELPLTHSFCQQVVASGKPLVISDTRTHPLVHDSPAIRDIGVIAYASLPLFTSDRYAVGTFCAIGATPREWTGKDLMVLEDLAAITMHEFQWAKTDHPNLTAQIEAEHALLQAVLQCMPVGVLIAESPSGRIVLRNSKIDQMWGGPLPQVASLDDYQQLVGFHRDGRRYELEEWPLVRAITTGEVVENAEIDLVRHDGTRTVIRVNVAPVRDSSGTMIAGVVVADDITELRRAEAERLAVERKLMESQKLESLGVLAGGIAHDFNNLLTVILGNAELALLDLPPGADFAHEQLERVSSAARRAASLTQLMLAYVGKGQFTLRQLDLNDLIAGMRVFIASAVPTTTLQYDLAATLPPIMADGTLLRQVVINLITNAVEALDGEPGTVTLRTGVRRADHAYLTDAVVGSDLPEAHYVYLEVVDTGPGMDAATRARIFDPFFTTKFVGRGLGLAAVLGIVRTHQGALKVQSEPGSGTSVTILFPLGAGARPADAGSQGATSEMVSVTILLVDDEEEIRRIAVRMLERLKFNVLTAANGSEGVEIYRANADKIALILLDMTMPRMSGVEVFHLVRQINPDARVVLMSGYDEQEATRQFAGEGLAGFLHKPFTLTDLRAKLNQVLNRSG
jgi:two-component system cell cycle sensor histidine kinase/response regulator CckA